MTRGSLTIDRIDATLDDPNLFANAGLVAFATLSQRLGLEALIDSMVRLVGRVGGAHPGRKAFTLVHAIIAGATHIDHVDMVRADSTGSVLGHRVMGPSTIGTFLRAFTFGHVRQPKPSVGRALGTGPGNNALVLDIDYTPGGQAQVTECAYTTGSGKHRVTRRLIVRRTRLVDTVQQRLWPKWRHRAFLTDLTADAVEVHRFHRHHAVVKLAIRDLKQGAGLEHVPSGNFHANSAWLQTAVLAHNPIRWTAHLGGVRNGDELTVARTMRTRLVAMPGRIANRAERTIVRLPTRWPWANTSTTALCTLRLLRPAPA